MGTYCIVKSQMGKFFSGGIAQCFLNFEDEIYSRYDFLNGNMKAQFFHGFKTKEINGKRSFHPVYGVLNTQDTYGTGIGLNVMDMDLQRIIPIHTSAKFWEDRNKERDIKKEGFYCGPVTVLCDEHNPLPVCEFQVHPIKLDGIAESDVEKLFEEFAETAFNFTPEMQMYLESFAKWRDDIISISTSANKLNKLAFEFRREISFEEARQSMARVSDRVIP